MKKFLLLLIFILSVPSAMAELSVSDINLFNLKEKNVYVLTFPSKINEFNITNEKCVGVSAMTTIYNDKKMLFIDAKQDGVSDVSIRTSEHLYQLRFVVGPEFQDNSKDIIMLDLPSVLLGGIE